MRSVKELTELLAEKTDEADALVTAGESGDLTEAQSRRWSAVMDEDSGEIPKLTAELSQARKKQDEQRGLAAAKLSLQGASPFRTEFDDELPGSRAAAGPKFRNLSNGQDICALLPDEKFATVEHRFGVDGEPNEAPEIGYLIHSLLSGQPQNMSSGKFNELVGGSDSGGGFILNPTLGGQVVDLARSASVAMRAGAVTLPMDAREMHLAV